MTKDVAEIVSEVVDAVRDRGDEALLRYTARFDGVELDARSLQVAEADIDAACVRLAPEVREAVDLAVASVQAHHRAQNAKNDWFVETQPGVMTGERYLPLPSVGLYVPRGKGNFPSVMVMLTVPARIAGVARPVVCTPPGPGGQIDDASLYAARVVGVETVFRVGGAQAIAALAHGTETIPKVEKIIGPGNQYVTYAKQLVYGVVDPGPPAGPSESIILADEAADSVTVAMELLVEAEHGPDSAAVLVTPSGSLAEAVIALVPGLIAELPEARREFCTESLSRFGGVVIARDWDDAITFCNEWAPEHLHVISRGGLDDAQRITNAGEVLVGPYSSIAIGNYVAGVNAILPTGGFARGRSCVGVDDFVKRSSLALVSRRGAARAAAAARTLAEYEGFPAHARAAQHVIDQLDASPE
ncbi:MAG: histidinol dehydrogenase [Solirubrobacteraceae bacterium]